MTCGKQVAHGEFVWKITNLSWFLGFRGIGFRVMRLRVSGVIARGLG